MTIGTCSLLSKQCITLWEPPSSNDVGHSSPNPHCQFTLACDLACRFALSDGVVETILTGMVSCGPVRRTAWGTIIVGEESGNDGGLMETSNPLQTMNVQFADCKEP